MNNLFREYTNINRTYRDWGLGQSPCPKRMITGEFYQQSALEALNICNRTIIF